MLQLERQKLILEYLKQNRKATTNELSEMLGVSNTTIRTDLNQMDKEKLLTKTHGGALYHDSAGQDNGDPGDILQSQCKVNAVCNNGKFCKAGQFHAKCIGSGAGI